MTGFMRFVAVDGVAAAGWAAASGHAPGARSLVGAYQPKDFCKNVASLAARTCLLADRPHRLAGSGTK